MYDTTAHSKPRRRCERGRADEGAGLHVARVLDRALPSGATTLTHKRGREVTDSTMPARSAVVMMAMAFLLPSSAAAEAAPATLDDRTKAALLEAVADERAIESYYAAVLERHGAEVMPFALAVEAERRRAAELVAVGRQFGVEVPAAAAGSDVKVPDTMKEACVAAVQAVKEKIAMYDGFLEFVTEEQVRSTFERLRTASVQRQEPAFTNCVDNDGKFLARADKAGACAGGCGMGGACGCANAAPVEKKRMAAGGGCGCAKRRQQQEQQKQQ